MADLKSMIPTEILDVQGRACPYPLVTTKKTMQKLPKGAVLKIFCDSSVTAEDSIPRYCEKNGYQFESVWYEEKGYWELYIRKD